MRAGRSTRMLAPDGVAALTYGTEWAEERSVPELLRISRVVLAELVGRGILRTLNAPAGDLAEYLVAAAYGGKLARNSEKSWDVLSAEGRRLQVKCRVSDKPSGSQLFSPFRSFEFDAAVFVILSPSDLSVRAAVELPVSVVEAHARYRAHVNGHVVSTRIVRVQDPRSIDITSRLRAALDGDAFTTNHPLL